MPEAAPPLKQLYVYLTEGCNLACRHCWIAPPFDPRGERSANLPLDLFAEVVREALPLGLEGVKLTGGEPLMHPRFTAFLDVVRDHGLKLNLETNGLLCTPKLVAELVRCPRRFVSVSLDGADPETHDGIRGVAGSFEAATRAVRDLVAAGLHPQIIMTVMRDNAGQIEAMIRLSGALGASSIKLNLVQPTALGAGMHRRGGALGVEELIRLGRDVDERLAPGSGLAVHFDHPMAFRSLSSIARGGGDNTCGVLSILGLLASGHYALCGMGNHTGGLVFGQAGQAQLAEIWRENPILRELRQGLPGSLGGICGRCLVRGRCLGACIAQNYYRTRSLWEPYWFCEQAAGAGLFPRSRLLPEPGRR